MASAIRRRLLGSLGLLTLALAFASPGAAPTLPRISIATGGRSFALPDGRPYVPFGVTYYRARTGWAPQLWKKFDVQATRDDFARMRELGINCVRVFLSYGSFYRTPGVLDSEGLAKFDRLLEIAEQNGIYVHPTGPDHWEGTPSWARADRIADEKALAALESFWKLFAARYRGRHAIFAYDLRNEPKVSWDSPVMRRRWNAWLRRRYGSASQLAGAWGVSPHRVRWGQEPPPEAKDAPGDRRLLDYQNFREDVADEWTRRQVAAIRSADPDALVTVGLIQWSVPLHLPHLQAYSGFRPERQAKLLDFLEIHFFPFERGFYEYRSARGEEQNLRYLERVVAEVARPGKPVVLAEFGWYGGGQPTFDLGRHPAASEEQQARWGRRVIETTRGLVAGWLNWGLYDDPEASDVSQLTGLLAADGRTKIWGSQFAELAQGLRREGLVRDLDPPAPLDWDLRVTRTDPPGSDLR